MPENEKMNREMGEQPIAKILRERGLSHHDLVAASARPITHKMVMRAERGRWLTPNTKGIVLDALNRAAGANYTLSDLFNY